jgi:hypothetical protein
MHVARIEIGQRDGLECEATRGDVPFVSPGRCSAPRIPTGLTVRLRSRSLANQRDQGGEAPFPRSSFDELVLQEKGMARLGSIFGNDPLLQCHEGCVSCTKRR